MHFKNLKPMVASNLDIKDSALTPEVSARFEVNDDIVANSEVNKFPKIPETAQRIKKDLPAQPIPPTSHSRLLFRLVGSALIANTSGELE